MSVKKRKYWLRERGKRGLEVGLLILLERALRHGQAKWLVEVQRTISMDFVPWALISETQVLALSSKLEDPRGEVCVLIYGLWCGEDLRGVVSACRAGVIHVAAIISGYH